MWNCSYVVHAKWAVPWTFTLGWAIQNIKWTYVHLWTAPCGSRPGTKWQMSVQNTRAPDVPSTARRLWWLRQSWEFAGSVFEDAHRTGLCYLKKWQPQLWPTSSRAETNTLGLFGSLNRTTGVSEFCTSDDDCTKWVRSTFVISNLNLAERLKPWAA